MNINRRQYTDKFTDFAKKGILDFTLYNSGIEYCKPGYSYGPKRRDYHFIHFVKEGKGLLEIQNQKSEVFKNQLFIVPAGEISTYSADESDPWEYAWIGFLGIQSLNFVQELLQSNNYKFVIDCNEVSFYEKRIQSIIDMSNNSLASFYKINGIMYDIIGNLLEECAKSYSLNNSTSIVYQAMRLMNFHYHDNIQISEIAFSVGVHPNYLSVLFKSEIGIGPKEYLTQLKINKAKELLVESNDQIYLVSSSVGFNDALSFSNFFKKEVGVSPSEYRRNIKKEKER